MKIPVWLEMKLANAQVGDDYRFGGEIVKGTKNPDNYDCSEFTEWTVETAASEIGLNVDFPDGADNQLAAARQGMFGANILTPEEASHIRGAFVYRTAGEIPGLGAHVVICEGDGHTTIEARSTDLDVGHWSLWEPGRKWTAGVVFHDLIDYKAKVPEDPVKEDDFFVVFGRYGGRKGREMNLQDVVPLIRDESKKHHACVVVYRKEPINEKLVKSGEYARFATERRKKAA